MPRVPISSGVSHRILTTCRADDSSDGLPCRILITAQGVEGFVYNRTPAYDAIVERMKNHEQEDNDAQKSFTDSNGASKGGNPNVPRLRKVAPNAGTDTPSDDRRSDDSNRGLLYATIAETQITR